VRLLTEVQQTTGFSVIAYAHALGLSVRVGTLATIVIAGLLIARAAVALRRDDEIAGFTWIPLIVLVASPIVWNHYLMILFVPLIVRAPQIDRRWLVIAPLGPVIVSSTADTPFLLPFVLAFVVGFVLVIARGPERPAQRVAPAAR